MIVKTIEELERENRELKEIIDKLSYEIEDIKTLTNSKLRQENYVKGKLVRELKSSIFDENDFRYGMSNYLLFDSKDREGIKGRPSVRGQTKSIDLEDLARSFILSIEESKIVDNFIYDLLAESRVGMCILYKFPKKTSSEYKLYTTPDYDKRDNFHLYRTLYCDGRTIPFQDREKYKRIEEILKDNDWKLPDFRLKKLDYKCDVNTEKNTYNNQYEYPFFYDAKYEDTIKDINYRAEKYEEYRVSFNQYNPREILINLNWKRNRAPNNKIPTISKVSQIIDGYRFGY